VSSRPLQQLYAAIDLGSNSFHMLIVREVAGCIQTVAKVKRKVRLAAGLNAANYLDQAAMERGWECLQLFAEYVQDIPPENIRVVATATLRAAVNANAFLATAEERLGHPIRVISGQEEAATIYSGVAFTSSGQGNRLVIDIGGASTELVVGEQFDAKILNSLNMGCVTWLGRYFPHGQLNEANFDTAISAAKEVLDPVVQDYQVLGWQSCVGASGTVQAIQEMLLVQGQEEQITLDKLQQLKQQSIACGDIDHLQLPGLQPERVPVFASGLAILIAIFEHLGVSDMTLAGGALREGLVYQMLGQDKNCSIRANTVHSLISRHQIDLEQAERVRKAATQLYEQLAGPWEILESEAKPLLRWSAMLHEIGLGIGYKQLHLHAAYIINHSDLPGFTPAQKFLVAALLRNQREQPDLALLTQQNALSPASAVKLTRILRLAIILSMRRRSGTLPKLQASVSGDKLVLRFNQDWLNEHPLRAAELRREQKLGETLGWQLEIIEEAS